MNCHFVVTSPTEILKINLHQEVKSKDREVGTGVLSGYCSKFGEVRARYVDIEGGRIFLLINVEPLGVPSKMPSRMGSCTR